MLVIRDDLPGDVVHHGLLVDEGGGVEHAIFQALFDDLPDSGLGQASGVHSFRLLYRYLLPLYQCRLHRHHDGAVVRYLVNGLGHDGVKDGDVLCPTLVQVVAFSMCHCAFPECRSEPCSHHLVVDLSQLSV